jgi:hypothetical protein
MFVAILVRILTILRDCRSPRTLDHHDADGAWYDETGIDYD